jgi:hypothetical protein
MRLSIYTFVKNGLFNDYHVVDMLRHHLPLADEIVVNEGYSTDGTFEAIRDLDPKVKAFRTHWGKADSFDWFLNFKNESRKRCAGDWCVLLDCDEFIPEWEFDRLRRHLDTTADDLAALRLTNFYGSYRVYHTRPDKPNWPDRKVVVHRNRPDVEVWGDGSNVRLVGRPDAAAGAEFACHHFGFVRSAARLREKWRNLQGDLHNGRRKWFKLPSFLFDLMPHRWDDPQFRDDLAVYEGPYLKAVRDNPAEFVRDGGRLYDLVKQRQAQPA